MPKDTTRYENLKFYLGVAIRKVAITFPKAEIEIFVIEKADLGLIASSIMDDLFGE